MILDKRSVPPVIETPRTTAHPAILTAALHAYAIRRLPYNHRRVAGQTAPQRNRTRQRSVAEVSLGAAACSGPGVAALLAHP